MPNRHQLLREQLERRILVLDGAMGTMIQALGLNETEVRGERFGDHHRDLIRFADIISLTRPDDLAEIHRRYFAAGADIVCTNTFGASYIGMLDFELPRESVKEINTAAVQCARKAADEFTERTPDKPRFVAGSIGPTAKQMAISTNVEDASTRDVTFDEMSQSYYEQVVALVEAGVDILLPETVIDTLNLKACLFAIQRYFDETGNEIPVMVSGTFQQRASPLSPAKASKRSGFPIAHFPLLSVGMNCAEGPDRMRPQIEELAKVATCYISCHPNAGLPNEMGQYDLSPQRMARTDGRVRRKRLAQHRGRLLRHDTRSHRGHCRAAVEGKRPHVKNVVEPYTRLSGTQPLTLRPDSNFTMIGERTNVTGSRTLCPSDSRRQLRGGRRSRPSASRRRGVDHRHQHGRCLAGWRSVDDQVLELDRR